MNVFPNASVDCTIFFLSFFFFQLFQLIAGDIYASENHHLVLLSHTQELFIHPSKGLCGW